MKGTTILITGGAGFIGSNFTRYILEKEKESRVLVVDNLSTGRLENLDPVISHPRLKFFYADLAKEEKFLGFLFQHYAPDYIVHFAAEAHVDESILNPLTASTNVLMTNLLLEKARQSNLSKFIYVSSDEVYGPIREGFADENQPLNPSSPYSASKAGCDLLCLAYYKTYGVPVLISRCTNNYGPYLDVRRLIARHITNALLNLPLPLWNGGQQIRDWLFVDDHCSALHLLMEKGKPGEIYNISSGNLLTNFEVANAILKLIPESKSNIIFKGSRPGHDVRYALDSSKIKGLGWKPMVSFDEGLRLTIEWFKLNKDWWIKVKEKVERDLYSKLGR